MNKSFKHLDSITALFVTVLLISNVASTKIVAFGPLTFDGGTILFPLSYIFGDILTEVYGYARSRKVIWLGFLATLIMAATFMIVEALPPAADWPNQDAYSKILGSDSSDCDRQPGRLLCRRVFQFAGAGQAESANQRQISLDENDRLDSAGCRLLIRCCLF